MAIVFTDPNSAGPFTTFQVKDVVTKVFKLTYSNFATGNVDTLIGRLPAGASILSFEYWNKTKLAGNSISAATLSVGSTSGGTEFVSAFDVFTTVGTQDRLSPVTGILQPQAYPLGTDIPLYVRGTSTTGTPTSGEIYLTVLYVR